MELDSLMEELNFLTNGTLSREFANYISTFEKKGTVNTFHCDERSGAHIY